MTGHTSLMFMGSQKKILFFLNLLVVITFSFSQNSYANVLNDQTWQSDFSGPYWGTETQFSCPTGSAIDGIAGKDAEGWITAGLKVNCKPIESTFNTGSANTIPQIMFSSTYWWWATWSDDHNCTNGKIGTGLRLQVLDDNYSNYLLNFGLDCKKYADQTNTEFSGYYGSYYGAERILTCPAGFWLTGINYKSGWGVDGLRIICSNFVNISSFKIVATSASGGSITPSGETNVLVGNNQTYAITPNPGFQVSTLVVDGILKAPATTYTFYGVSSNHSISATFIDIQGNRQSTLGSCSSSSSNAATRSLGNGATQNSNYFCGVTNSPSKNR